MESLCLKLENQSSKFSSQNATDWIDTTPNVLLHRHRHRRQNQRHTYIHTPQNWCRRQNFSFSLDAFIIMIAVVSRTVIIYNYDLDFACLKCRAHPYFFVTLVRALNSHPAPNVPPGSLCEILFPDGAQALAFGWALNGNTYCSLWVELHRNFFIKWNKRNEWKAISFLPY